MFLRMFTTLFLVLLVLVIFPMTRPARSVQSASQPGGREPQLSFTLPERLVRTPQLLIDRASLQASLISKVRYLPHETLIFPVNSRIRPSIFFVDLSARLEKPVIWVASFEAHGLSLF